MYNQSYFNLYNNGVVEIWELLLTCLPLIPAWITNHILSKAWNVLLHSQMLTDAPLKYENECIISSHTQ